MLTTKRVISDSLLKHGALMIVLGTGVCALGSLMAKPVHEQVGYVSAAVFLTAGLVIALLSPGLRSLSALPRLLANTYAAIASLMVCYLAVQGYRVGSFELPMVGLITALLALCWGFRYISLACTFPSYSPQAYGLCALAAADSSFGVILASRTGLGKLGIVTMAGCYVIALGIQVYLTAVLLHRGVARARAFERS